MRAVRKIAGPNGNREEEEELKSVRKGKGCYMLEGKARFRGPQRIYGGGKGCIPTLTFVSLVSLVACLFNLRKTGDESCFLPVKGHFTVFFVI